MDSKRRNVRIQQAFIDVALLILLNESKQKYGLQMSKMLDTRFGISVGECTLYPRLDRLLKEKLVTCRWAADSQGGQLRKYYRITKDGVAAMNAVLEQMRTFIARREKSPVVDLRADQ